MWLFVRLYLRLCVGLQSQEAADLSVLGVNDAGAHKVGGVGVDGVEQGHAKAQDLKVWQRSSQVCSHVVGRGCVCFKKKKEALIASRSPKLNRIFRLEINCSRSRKHQW